VRLVPLAEARAAFLAKIAPAASTSMATAKGGGLVVAEDVLAPVNIPATALALERGYALASRATVGASSYLPAMLTIAPLLIEVGDALPAGTDAIADKDDVRETPAAAEVIAPVAPGRRARAAGGDFAAGKVMVSAGSRLQASQIAVLRAAGIKELPVRMPAVTILAPRGSCPAAALVMDMVAQASGDVQVAYVPETRLAGALGSAGSADLVLVAGWSGTAHHAAISSLAKSGRVVARDLAVAPGTTMACGYVGADGLAPVVLLPGRLEETLAAWLMLARPALDRLAGFAGSRPSAALPLARKIASAPGMVDIALVRRQEGKWKPLAVGDISWTALARAEAWLAVPGESEGFASGEIVEAEFL
jgi:molybdopterin biosynthesis enzyme